MKTLTVRQPWAWAIARGHKNVENRGWSTTHRGPLAIHAALRPDDAGVDALRFVRDTVRAADGRLPARLADDAPYCDGGVLLAVVELVDVCRASLDADAVTCDYNTVCDCGPWAQPGQAHWKLANARVLAEPIPARGHLSLWDCEVSA